MARTQVKAQDVINRLNNGEKLALVKTFYDDQEWFRISSKVYDIKLKEAKRRNKENEGKKNVAGTYNDTIVDILNINEKLSNYALGVPISATAGELAVIQNLVANLPDSEQQIIAVIERFNMHPKWRALQKIGRIRQYDAFKEFDKIVDASLICYYRENYISCFLTLAPVIEGVLLRWLGYTGVGEKPEFEMYRKFFKQGPMRQPDPYNIQFHQVFSKVCDSIINKTLYKPTTTGTAHSDFNRHLALHLLKSPNFGTKNNCIRLFVILDLMTEIYWYEGKFEDPRWDLTTEDTVNDIEVYGNLLIDQTLLQSAERKILHD